MRVDWDMALFGRGSLSTEAEHGLYAILNDLNVGD